jgi:phosphoglycerate dehydrogenase-like enzyme
MHTHLLRPLPDEAQARLRAALAPGSRLTTGDDLPAPPTFDVLVAGVPTRQQLAASPHLRALVIPWAGLPDRTRALLRDFPGVAAYNLHHNAAPTAEMAMSLLLAAAKRLIPVDQRLRTGDWSDRYRRMPALLLTGKTALILGYGAIGWRVAAACRGLGMRVLAVRRAPTADKDDIATIFPPTDLPGLLPQAHVLVVCLPLTAETEGLIGAAELALLAPGAVLVNVGRGPVVDQQALYEALRDGRLGGAGLDVWYNYPTDEESRAHTPPADYPFGNLENVVMSPHRGGMGGQPDTEDLRADALAALLNALARGEEPETRIELERGY